MGVAVVLPILHVTLSAGIVEIEREPINYKTTPVQDRVQRLLQDNAGSGSCAALEAADGPW